MRIVKLAKTEEKRFATREGVRRFFLNEIGRRKLRGKFYVTPGRIAPDGLRPGEQLVFTYQARVVFSARAESRLLPNDDAEQEHQKYPNYFVVDLATLREADEDVHDIEREYNIPLGGRGWNTLPDSPTTEAVWARLGGTEEQKLLEEKPTDGSELPLKDESDIKSLQQAQTVNNRRIHNKLTNKLKTCLPGYTLLEGCSKAAIFDVLVKDYDGNGSDLLVEVKSLVEEAHIRMAIGQLFDYWFCVKGDAEPHIAILLPSSPDAESKRLLEWLHIGLLWFSGEKLKTCSDWLDGLVGES